MHDHDFMTRSDISCDGLMVALYVEYSILIINHEFVCERRTRVQLYPQVIPVMLVMV